MPNKLTLDDLPENELREEFICAAAGPGGQHVNRTATTVRLFFDTACTTLLSPEQGQRLLALAGHQAVDSQVIITAGESRSLAVNRGTARRKLLQLLNQAMVKPRPRRPTKISKAVKARRALAKTQHSRLKQSRRTLED